MLVRPPRQPPQLVPQPPQPPHCRTLGVTRTLSATAIAFDVLCSTTTPPRDLGLRHRQQLECNSSHVQLAVLMCCPLRVDHLDERVQVRRCMPHHRTHAAARAQCDRAGY